jgi:hypothetical protein
MNWVSNPGADVRHSFSVGAGLLANAVVWGLLAGYISIAAVTAGLWFRGMTHPHRLHEAALKPTWFWQSYSDPTVGASLLAMAALWPTGSGR